MNIIPLSDSRQTGIELTVRKDRCGQINTTLFNVRP